MREEAEEVSSHHLPLTTHLSTPSLREGRGGFSPLTSLPPPFGRVRDGFLTYLYMKDFINDYFKAKGDAPIADDYFAFCDWIHDQREYSEKASQGVFTNLDFKKALAKRIVSDMMNGSLRFSVREIIDQRLRALVTYYFSIHLYSHDTAVAEAAAKAFERFRSIYHQLHIIHHGSVIIDPSPEAIVTMRSEDSLYRGYRFFIINMLCFTSSRFMIGMRTDGEVVKGPMKYYKGCRPMGIRKADNGMEWNIIECDNALSDDHLAILSNQLDGDGTIEICDWINNGCQRVIFRRNY